MASGALVPSAALVPVTPDPSGSEATHGPVDTGPEESGLGELSGGADGIPPGMPGGGFPREDLTMTWAPARISPRPVSNMRTRHRTPAVRAGFG